VNQAHLFEHLDHPAVNASVFFPRPDPGRPLPPGSEEIAIAVEQGVTVSARYHPASAELPTVLHFHGNGEIVSDYDDLAPAYHQAGASLICADYRGYGRSTGQPSVRALIRDSHTVLDFVLEWLHERGHTGPLVVMGRSLGSAPAIELASARENDIDGLIIESGFAQSMPLLGLFGLSLSTLGLDKVIGMDNDDKLATVRLPLLLLHAENDNLLPPWHAQKNFERATPHQKRLVLIPNTDHNTIIALGGQRYWGAIREFLAEIRGC
jgi:alpha-beta hydrolase superfamily lysophospholipase